MSHPVHIIWGSSAAGLYRSGFLDMSVRLAHSRYDFANESEARGFLQGVAIARGQDDWVQVCLAEHIKTLGPPFVDTLLEASRKGDVRVAVQLLHLGANVDHIGSDGMAAVHYAAKAGHGDMIAALVEYGADVNLQSRCRDETSALHLCVPHTSQAHMDCMRFLLDARARPTDVDVRGNSALHVASAWGNAEAVALLLKEGAYADGQNHEGMTPLDVAGAFVGVRALDGGELGRAGEGRSADSVRAALQAAIAARENADDAAVTARWRKHFPNFGFTRKPTDDS